MTSSPPRPPDTHLDEALTARRDRLRAILGRTPVQAAVIGLVTFAVYWLVGNPDTPYDHYVRLTDAFLHGDLYLTHPPDYLELARYDSNHVPCTGAETQSSCHGYVIDPPAPTLLILPFFLLFGPGLNAATVAAFWGAVAIALFWIASERLGWQRPIRIWMTALIAVGTDFWWATTDGSLWTFAQTAAVVFSMAALVVASPGEGARAWLVGLLVGLAGLCRLPIFVGFPFFLYLVLRRDIEGRPWREVIRLRAARIRTMQFGLALGAMAAISPLYNWARYGTITDKGFHHPQYDDEPWFTQGRFDLSYIPRNVEALFFSGPVQTPGHFPYFAPTVSGMALFLVTPAFLLAFAARRRPLELMAAGSLALIAVPHVLHGVWGFSQFGYRYSLDYLPMLAVLTASGMRHRVSRRAWLLLAVCIFMSAWGPVFFFDTRFEDLIRHQWVLPR